MVVHPYRRASNNLFEGTCLLVLLLTYCGSVVSGLRATSSQTSVIGAVALFLKGTLVLYAVVRKIRTCERVLLQQQDDYSNQKTTQLEITVTASATNHARASPSDGSRESHGFRRRDSGITVLQNMHFLTFAGKGLTSGLEERNIIEMTPMSISQPLHTSSSIDASPPPATAVLDPSSRIADAHTQG
jgi:hypothetical protein